ncbi:Uncharacterised protein [Halioglobus japonicus]|nr:Uncharacterised protein [Halioglobus japonicus]
MRHLKTLSICLSALAFHSATWAEIYETTDAQGNPEFTDSPPGPNAAAIDLQQTNIIDAPTEMREQVSAPQPVAQEQEQAPEPENRTVIVNDSNNDEDDVYDDYLQRERAFERMDPDAPREVGDSNSQMPREVGDSNSQMPDEVGDFDTVEPEVADEADTQIIREANDSHIQREKNHPLRR